MTKELTASPHGCEEASEASSEFYIPCNRPATHVVYHERDDREYRMCAAHARHNVKNRGAQDRGVYAHATIGDNNPPIVDPDILAAETARVRQFADAAGAWLDLGKVETEEQAGKLTDFISGARGVVKQIDAARVEAKKPFDAGAKAVQAAYTPLLDAVEKSIAKLKPLLTDYLQRKKAMQEAEAARQKAEAEKAAAEAEAARQAAQARHDVLGEAEAERAAEAAQKAAEAAAAPVRANVASYSGGGRSAGLRTQKTVVIENIRQVFLSVQDDPAVVEAIAAAVTRKVRARDWDGRVPAGCRIETTQVAA